MTETPTLHARVKMARDAISDLLPGSSYWKIREDYYSKGHLAHANYIAAKEIEHREALAALPAEPMTEGELINLALIAVNEENKYHQVSRRQNITAAIRALKKSGVLLVGDEGEK